MRQTTPIKVELPNNVRNPYEENTKEADDKLSNNNNNVSASDIHIETSDDESALQNPYTFETLGTSPNNNKWLSLLKSKIKDH